MDTTENRTEELRTAWERGIRPSAAGANLRGADLHEANLRGADLLGANLHGADLHGAVLRGADLHEANLRWADLLGANLHGANLREADLHEANLRGANLRWADLREADLREADLREANLRGANLRWANLHGAAWSGLLVDGLPSGQAILVPTPRGWSLVFGRWSGNVAGLRDIIDGRVEPPEALGDEIDRLRPGWIAVAALCEAHILANPGAIEDLAAKWPEVAQ